MRFGGHGRRRRFRNSDVRRGRDNEQAKYLATLEINALIDGALEGGATDPIVLDGHGSGGVNKAAREDVERVDTHTVKITGDTIAEIAKKR